MIRTYCPRSTQCMYSLICSLTLIGQLYYLPVDTLYPVYRIILHFVHSIVNVSTDGIDVLV